MGLPPGRWVGGRAGVLGDWAGGRCGERRPRRVGVAAGRGGVPCSRPGRACARCARLETVHVEGDEVERADGEGAEDVGDGEDADPAERLAMRELRRRGRGFGDWRVCAGASRRWLRVAGAVIASRAGRGARGRGRAVRLVPSSGWRSSLSLAGASVRGLDGGWSGVRRCYVHGEGLEDVRAVGTGCAVLRCGGVGDVRRRLQRGDRGPR